MRSYYFPIRWVVIALVTVCSAVAVQNSNWSRADEPSDGFKPGTVWQGNMVRDKHPYFHDQRREVMIVYVKRRKAATFEALVWYPTRGNRLLTLTGKVGKAGRITMIERKLVHDDDSKKGGAVAPGLRFTGQPKENNLKGSWQWTGPNFLGFPITGNFILKLAN